jgi:uncharacterized repeat protein (TIGR02543 family)
MGTTGTRDSMRAITLAAALSALIACAIAFCTPASAFADGGSVTVTGSDQAFASIDEASAAVAANGTTGDITYTVTGSVDFNAGHGGAYNTLAPAGVTSVTIVGASNAEVTLTGSYETMFYTTPNGRTDGTLGVPLTMKDLTVNDGRTVAYEGTAWEMTYLGSNAPDVNFANVTFTEGYMVGSATMQAGQVQTGTFEGCTFGIGDPLSDKDDPIANKLEHYELWLSGQASASVDNCTFTPNAYGAIKGTYDNTYPMYYKSANVKLSVTNSTVNGIGHHRVVHLDGCDGLTFTGNTITNCYNSDAHDKTFIDAKEDKSGDVAAINNDYFGDNAYNNTVQYSFVLMKDGTQVTAPAYYQYNQTMDSYSVDGYIYSLANGATFADTLSMLPANSLPGMYTSTANPGFSVFTAAALTDTDDAKDATSLPVSSAAPRQYDLVKGTPITYSIAFDKNADDATGTMTPLDATYDQDVALTANAFAREGYTFAGWNTSADGTGTAYADKASVKNLTTEAKAPVTLYAQWKQITHTVTFTDPDGGTTTDPQTIADGALATEPATPTRDGYTFDGWYLNDQKYDFSTPVTGDVTLTAKWTANAPASAADGTPAAKDTIPQTADTLAAVAPIAAVVALIACGVVLVTLRKRRMN